LGLAKKTIGLPSFLSSYSLSFPFNRGLEGLDDVGVAIAEEEEDSKKGLKTTEAILGWEAKVCGGTASGALGSEIKGNETRKDYNALTGPAIVTAGVGSVFGYRRGRSSSEESSSTLDGSRYSEGVAISYLC
jgi:hypothetical protein